MRLDVPPDAGDLDEDARLERAEAWLLGRELFGIRPGLSRMVALLGRLGDPQAAFDAIHVVGSNGKTSTVTMTAALLERRGVRSGAYVSPHLVSFRERVLVAGVPAAPGVFAAAVARVRRAAEELEAAVVGAVPGTAEMDGPVTQFEAVTAAAFVVLADAGVACAVVEAGLGGRWDATNVLPRGAAGHGDRPATGVTVLTSISLEHTRWLGDTVEAIAAEKVAVLRPGGTLVLAQGLPPAAHDVAEARAGEQGGTVVEAAADPGPDVPTPGAARFQRRNLATAIAAVGAHLASLPGAAAERDPVAERDVATRVVVPGRFEVVERPAPGDADGVVVIHDGAHNEAGFEALADALDATSPRRPVVAVVGVLDDKDPAGMLAALERWCDVLVATAPSNPRRLEADGLAAVAASTLPGRETHVVPGAHDALARARTLAGPRGTVLVTGSLHLVADLRRGPGVGPGARF